MLLKSIPYEKMRKGQESKSETIYWHFWRRFDAPPGSATFYPAIRIRPPVGNISFHTILSLYSMYRMYNGSSDQKSITTCSVEKDRITQPRRFVKFDLSAIIVKPTGYQCTIQNYFICVPSATQYTKIRFFLEMTLSGPGSVYFFFWKVIREKRVREIIRVDY